MKNILKTLPLAILTLFLFSCGGESENKGDVKMEEKHAEKHEKKHESKVEKIKDEAKPKELGKEIKITVEDSYSPCYISEFIYKDGKTYIVVDYVIIQELDVEEHGEGAFEIVNNNPKLRTFVAKKETFLTCGQNKSRTVKELEAQYKEDPKQLFTVKVVKGELEMFYIDTCSG